MIEISRLHALYLIELFAVLTLAVAGLSLYSRQLRKRYFQTLDRLRGPTGAATMRPTKLYRDYLNEAIQDTESHMETLDARPTTADFKSIDGEVRSALLRWKFLRAEQASINELDQVSANWELTHQHLGKLFDEVATASRAESLAPAEVPTEPDTDPEGPSSAAAEPAEAHEDEVETAHIDEIEQAMLDLQSVKDNILDLQDEIMEQQRVLLDDALPQNAAKQLVRLEQTSEKADLALAQLKRQFENTEQTIDRIRTGSSDAALRSGALDAHSRLERFKAEWRELENCLQTLHRETAIVRTRIEAAS